MIYITQGHENGIGLEVFLKSFICLESSFTKKFTLIIFEEDLLENLSNLKVKYEFREDGIKLNNLFLSCTFLTSNSNLPHSTQSLDLAVKLCTPDDILMTLPTSKDQLFFNNIQVNGHTEYFRKLYRLDEIAMTFLGENSNFLLLSDHIAIEEVPKYLSLEFIVRKVSIALEGFVNQRKINEVFFSGINPHCGESGKISQDDLIVEQAIIKLSEKFPPIKFHGPIAGDTMHFQINNKNQLFIYAFHDQGLAPFKLKYGLTGINYSVGLPYKRVSVDHGTAFDLYGKNEANYIGMLYLLDELRAWV